jgi:type 1 glutamine amidotransferase
MRAKELMRVVAGLLAGGLAGTAVAAEPVQPIRALLITGGEFHDFTAQKKILTEGISARANVVWTVVQEGTTREHRLSRYERADWAGGFDVVVHNECFGLVDDRAFVERVAAPHQHAVPAVILHASVISYRNAPTDAWREVIGQRSMGHEDRRDLVVQRMPGDHPVMKGFPATWPDAQDELYKIEKTWPGVVPLAKAWGEETRREHVVVWLNTIGGTRVFVTTLGHTNATMQSSVYLDLVARGLLWACSRLGDDGRPLPGYEARQR